MTILTCEHGTSTLTAAGEECAKCRLQAAESSAAAAEVDPHWEGVIGVEGKATGDGRLIEVGSLSWDLPILLRYVPEDNGAHDGAQAVGLVETIDRIPAKEPGVVLLWGTGIVDVGDEVGRDVHRKLKKGTAGGVSMDLDDVTFEVRVARSDPVEEEFDADDVNISVEPGHTVVVTSKSGDEITATTEARVRALTMVQIPAFIEARIHLVSSNAAADDVPLAVDAYRTGPLSKWVARAADGVYRFLVAAGFNPDQLRWPKGSPFHWGGRWMETPWKVGGAFLDFWDSLFGGVRLTDLGKGWRGSDPRAAQVIQALTAKQLQRLTELTAPNGSIRKIVKQLDDAGVNTDGEALFKSVSSLSSQLHEVSDLVQVSGVDMPELEHVVGVVDNYVDAGPLALQSLLDANQEGVDAPTVDVDAAFSEAVDQAEPGFFYDVTNDTYTNSLGYSLVGHDGVYDVRVDGHTIADTFDVPAEAMQTARNHYESTAPDAAAAADSALDGGLGQAVEDAIATLAGYDSVLPVAAQSATMRKALDEGDIGAVEAARAALDTKVWPEGNPVFGALSDIHRAVGGDGDLQGVVYEPVTGHSSSKPLPNPFDALTDEEMADAIAAATDATEVANYNRGHVEMWDRVASMHPSKSGRVTDSNGGVLAANIMPGDVIKIGDSGWVRVDQALTFGQGAEMRTYVDAGGRGFTVPANSRVRARGMEGGVSADVDDTVADLLDALIPGSDKDLGEVLFKANAPSLGDVEKAAMRAIFQQAMGLPVDQADVDTLSASPDDTVTVTMGGVQIPFDTTPFKQDGDGVAVVPDGTPSVQDVAADAVVDEVAAAMPASTLANAIAEATLNPKKVRDQLLAQDPGTFTDTKLRALVAARLVKQAADAREVARKAELGDADLAGWVAPDSGNTVRVENEAQKLLMEQALLPHITTGRWQNYGAKGASQDWVGATVVVDPSNVGRNFATVKDNFDFTGRDFIVSDGDSMLKALQAQLGTDYTEADMMLDLGALKGVVRTQRPEWTADDALAAVEAGLDDLQPVSGDTAIQIAARGGTARAIRRGLRKEYPDWSNAAIFAASKKMEANYAPYVGLSPDGLRQAAVTDVNMLGKVPMAIQNVAQERGIDLNSPNAPTGTVAPAAQAVTPPAPAVPDAAPAVPDQAPAVPETNAPDVAPDISGLDPFGELDATEIADLDALPDAPDAGPQPVEGWVLPENDWQPPQATLDIIAQMSDAELQTALDGWIDERDNFMERVPEADRASEAPVVLPTIAALEAEQAKRAAAPQPAAPAAPATEPVTVPDVVAPAADRAPDAGTPDVSGIASEGAVVDGVVRTVGDVVDGDDWDNLLGIIDSDPSWTANAALRAGGEGMARWVYATPTRAELQDIRGGTLGFYDFGSGDLVWDRAALEGVERDLIDETVAALDPNDNDTLFINDTLANGGHWEKGGNGWDLVDGIGQYVAFGHIGIDGATDSAGNPDEDTVRLTALGRQERDNWLAGQAADEAAANANADDTSPLYGDDRVGALAAVQDNDPASEALIDQLVGDGEARWEQGGKGNWLLLNQNDDVLVAVDTIDGSVEYDPAWQSLLDAANAPTTPDAAAAQLLGQFVPSSSTYAEISDLLDAGLLRMQDAGSGAWDLVDDNGRVIYHMGSNGSVLSGPDVDAMDTLLDILHNASPASGSSGAPIVETKPDGTIAFTPSAQDAEWSLLDYQGEYMGRNGDNTTIHPLPGNLFEVQADDGEIGTFDTLDEAKSWAGWKLSGEQDADSAMATLANREKNGAFDANLYTALKQGVDSGALEWERDPYQKLMRLGNVATGEMQVTVDDYGNVDVADALGGPSAAGDPNSPTPTVTPAATIGNATVVPGVTLLDPLNNANVIFDAAFTLPQGWENSSIGGTGPWLQFSGTEVQIHAQDDGTFRVFPDFTGGNSEVFGDITSAAARGEEMAAAQGVALVQATPYGRFAFTSMAETNGWLRTGDPAWMRLGSEDIYVSVKPDGTFKMWSGLNAGNPVEQSFKKLQDAVDAGVAVRDAKLAAAKGQPGETYVGQNGQWFFSPATVPSGWSMTGPADVLGGQKVIRNAAQTSSIFIRTDGTFTAARIGADDVPELSFFDTFAEAFAFVEGRSPAPQANLAAAPGTPKPVRSKFTLADLDAFPDGWTFGGNGLRSESLFVADPNSNAYVRVEPKLGVYSAHDAGANYARFNDLDDAIAFATAVGHHDPDPLSEHESVAKGVVDPATPLPDALSATTHGDVLDATNDLVVAVDPDRPDAPYVALADDGSPALFDSDGPAHFGSVDEVRDELEVAEDDGGQQEFYRPDGTPLDPNDPAEAALIAILAAHPNKSYKNAKDALKAARQAQHRAKSGEFFAVLGNRRVKAAAVSSDREGYELDPSEAPLFAQLAQQMWPTMRGLPGEEDLDQLADPAFLAGKRLFVDTHGLALAAVDPDGRIHGPFTIANKSIRGAHGEAKEELLRKAVRGGGRYARSLDASRADGLAEIGLVATHSLPNGSIVYRYDPEYVGSTYDPATVQAAPDLQSALDAHEAHRQAVLAQPFHIALDQGEKGDGHVRVTVPDPKDPTKTISKSGPWGLYGANGMIARNVDANGVERYLMVQRSKAVSGAGQWQFPGGAQNSNESAEEGAAREMLEELSPPPGWLGTLSKVGQTVTGNPAAPGWQYTTFAVDAPTQFKPKFDYETADAKWLTAQEIADLAAMGKLTSSVGRTVHQTMGLFGKPLPAPSPRAKTAAAVQKAGLAVGRGIKDRAAKMLANLGGSNGGQKWEVPLPDGTVGEFAVKKLSKDWGQQEALASALYRAVGVDAPEATYDVKTGALYTKWVDGLSLSLTAPTATQGARDGFVADAWLANWDAPVNGGNIAQTRDGKAIRMDNGGALEFRARGTRKPTTGHSAFDGTVDELDSMRKRPAGQNMYGARGASPDDWEVAAAQRIVDLDEEQIRALVAQHGQPDTLADKLVARRDYIANRYQLTPTPKPEPAQDALPAEDTVDELLARALGDSAFDSDHPEGSVAGIVPSVSHGLAAEGTPVDVAATPRTDLSARSGTLYDIPMSDGTTKQFAVVDPVSPEQGKRIHLASMLYDEVGIKGVVADFDDRDGKVYIEAVPAGTGTATPGDENARFALDAWLGRIMTRTGFDAQGDKVVTDYRGYLGMDSKGGTHSFGTSVSELDKFRDGTFSRSPYGTRSGGDDPWEYDSASMVASVSDGRIRELVAQAGLDEALADTLIARRDKIAKRYGIVDERALGAPNGTQAALADAAESLWDAKVNMTDADKINYVRVASAANGGSSLFDEVKNHGGLERAFDAAWRSRNPGKPDKIVNGIDKRLGATIPPSSRLNANQVTHTGAGLTVNDVADLAQSFDLSDKAWNAAAAEVRKKFPRADDRMIAFHMIAEQRGWNAPSPIVTKADFETLVSTTHRHLFRGMGQSAKAQRDDPVAIGNTPMGGRAWGTSIYAGTAGIAHSYAKYNGYIVDWAFDSQNAAVVDNDQGGTFANTAGSIAQQIQRDSRFTPEQKRILAKVFDYDSGAYAGAAMFFGFDATRGNFQNGASALSVLNRNFMITHDRDVIPRDKMGTSPSWRDKPGIGPQWGTDADRYLSRQQPRAQATHTLAEARAHTVNGGAAPKRSAAQAAPTAQAAPFTPDEAKVAANLGLDLALGSPYYNPAALAQFVRDVTAKFGVDAQVPRSAPMISNGLQRVFDPARAMSKGDTIGMSDLLRAARMPDGTRFRADVGRYHRLYELRGGLIYNANTGKPVEWINDIIKGTPGKASAALRKYRSIGLLVL